MDTGEQNEGRLITVAQLKKTAINKQLINNFLLPGLIFMTSR
ncbi:hypothetical protein P349_04894 [Enterobacter sp. DC4]|nr:hypothetical protein [Enterobacter sp. DC4]EWG65842.1 hypothetical protein P349_04894 [Enterobacter sp. DC4]